MNLFPKLMLIPVAFFFILIGITGVSYITNQRMIQEWLASPPPPGKIVNISNGEIYATVRGARGPIVVIISSLGTSSLEYEKLQKLLSDRYRVVTYDRSGYAWSRSKAAPSLNMRSVELYELLKAQFGDIEISERQNLFLVGHQYGARVAKTFAAKYPDLVKGIVYVDPLIMPVKFLDLHLDKDLEYVVDYTKSLKRSTVVAKLGLFRFFNMTPYDVPESMRSQVLSNLAYPVSAATALNEYLQGDFETQLKGQESRVRESLVTHSASSNLKLLKENGFDDTTAEKVERFMHDRYVEFLDSKSVEVIEAKNSVFSTHIDEPEIIEKALNAVDHK